MVKATQTIAESGDVPFEEMDTPRQDVEAKAREILDTMPEAPNSAQVEVRGEAREVAREGDVGLGAYLQIERGEVGDEATVAYRAIVNQILAAETPQDVLTPVEAVNLKELLETPIVIGGFTAHRSEFEVGSPYYAAIEAMIVEEEEKVILVTGNQAVLAQLVSLRTKHEAAHAAWQVWDEKGRKGPEPQPVFPIACKVVERGRPNSYGNRPLRLVTPDWEPKR